MTDAYLEGIMNRDNEDNESLNNVPYPICPVNMYFEGDEDKCDTSKCDFEFKDRSCTEACKIGGEEQLKELPKIKPPPKGGCRTVVAPLMLIDNEIYDAKGRLIAKVWQEDVGECLRTALNSHPRLVEELDDYKEGCKGLKLAIQDLRPYADCYKRVCESLGIEKDVLGYVKKLTEQRDDLLTACENLVHRASCVMQSHQCLDHGDNECCDRTYMLEAIKEGKKIAANIKKKEAKHEKTQIL